MAAFRNALLAGAAMVALLQMPAQAQDITWPTYSQVSTPADGALTCGQLDAEIKRVSSDIEVLAKAHHQVDEHIRAADAYRRSATGRESGQYDLKFDTTGYEHYPAVLKQIEASEKNAHARRDHLARLKATCR